MIVSLYILDSICYKKIKINILCETAKETGQDIFSGVKDAMRIVGRREAGFDVGPARQPLLSASETRLNKLEAAFEALGFFTW